MPFAPNDKLTDLTARRAYQDVVRQSLDILVLHRRNMLRLLP